jgi:hypothetical protein
VTTLEVRLTKRSDGGAVLRCRRADGSVTWQTHQGPRASFFPLHDLTHFAVESELPDTVAFFGLIAAGWNIDDTAGKGARGPLPPEAVLVEHIVGLLDLERATGHVMSGTELRSALADAGWPAPALPDDLVARMRARWVPLLDRWAALPSGGILDLEFHAPSLRAGRA